MIVGAESASAPLVITSHGSRNGMNDRRGPHDALIGAVVVAVIGLAVGILYAKDRHAARAVDSTGYLVTARFNRADGVGIGSDVRVSGVSVGKVVDQTLGVDFRAALTMRVASAIQLTADTDAVIHTDGLLGAKYIELRPGGDQTLLKPGGEIVLTQDALVIEELMDMIIQQAKTKRGYADKPLPTITN